MTQKEYLNIFQKMLAEEFELTRIKNQDYAQSGDAFANFRRIEDITDGRISLEDGILCRITDKLSRVANLIKNTASVKEESLEDNLKDISVYARIWRIYRIEKLRSDAKNNLKNAGTDLPIIESKEEYLNRIEPRSERSNVINPDYYNKTSPIKDEKLPPYNTR